MSGPVVLLALHTTADVQIPVWGLFPHRSVCLMDRFHPLLKATQICIKTTGQKQTNLFNNIHLAGRSLPDLYSIK
jgi:hypothetical protein